MQLGGLLPIAHYFAYVQVLQINAMQVNVFSFIFLGAELRLLERGHKNYFTEVLHCVFYCQCWVIICYLFLLFVLVLDFFHFVVKVLPCYVWWFFLLWRAKGFLTLNDWKLLFFHGLLLFQENKDISSFLLDHGGKVIHAMFRNGPFFGVVLDAEHLTYNVLLEDFNRLEVKP